MTTAAGCRNSVAEIQFFSLSLL